MNNRVVERNFFYGLLLIVIIFTLFLFRPFLAVIVIGASFSIVLHPLHEWLMAKITKGNSWAAALLTVIICIIVIGGPLYGIGVLIFNQSQDVYTSVVANGGSSKFIQKIGDSINRFLPTAFSFDIQDKLRDLVSIISSNLTKIFATTLSTIAGFLLTVLTMFYFLKDGVRWRKALVILSPLSDTDDEKILAKLSQAVNGVIKGYFLIGIVQGILMGIGLAIFGVPHAAIWGLLTAIASLVPTVGTTLIALPAILFLLATGTPGQAIGLTIWCLIIVGTVDNLLSPIVIGRNTSVPPLLILFSVLGGIALLGPVGILIGPLTVSLLYALISIYRTGLRA